MVSNGSAHRNGAVRPLRLPAVKRRLRDAFRWARRTPSAVLLVVQLASVLVYPFTEETGAGRTVVSIIGLIALGLAVLAVRQTPALNIISVVIGLPAVVLTIWQTIEPDSGLINLLSGFTHAAFYFYTAYALIRYMFADNWVTRDEMFATGTCFTVAAWGFAYLYGGVQVIWPTAFVAAGDDPTAPLSWMQLLFLSFTTMTNTGLSDLAPGSPHGRSFLMLEELAGLYYVALVVARLLGLTLAKFRR
ncbi:MAG TPA: ion channel [Segeticoccus sp.]|uniref:ion channel n=1 Tax=Segeticoccus sp. TaxID=2706531 RepID=UPI002D801C2D|nr:ion channel [Segeticoccus sp.]HET8598878.1 ion channel [Segeticoccus sp.]